LPVNPNDKCHYVELGLPIEQVRFWEEEIKGKKIVKMEYPENFFGANASQI
jgi:hypothetical protein